MHAGRALLPFALIAALLPGCGDKKKDDPPPAAKTAAPPPPAPKPPPPPPPKPAFDVPFKGTYARTAKVTYQNGRRVKLVNAGGTATLSVEAGKVTYTQTYPEGAKTSHVTQTYTFTPADMRAVNGGHDVALTFQKMDSDTKNYSPDSQDPKMEVRKQGTSWEIGFLYRDTKGIQGGMEFR